MFAGVDWLSARSSLLQQLGDAVEQRLVEEMQPPRDFLLDRGLLQPQFAGHPQKFDFVAQLIDDAGAFARGPARLLELDQQAVDAAVLLEHRDPLGFGRMRGDHRTHARRGQLFARAPAASMPSLAAFAMTLAKVPWHGLVAEVLLDAAALAPSPHPARRSKAAGTRCHAPEKRATETPARPFVDDRLAGQHRRDLRVMTADDFEQQLEEKRGDDVAGGRRFARLARIGARGCR